MQKNKFFSYLFVNLPAGTLHYLHSWKFIFLLKFCVKILFCKHYFSPLNTFMRKGKDPNPEPDPEPVPEPDPEPDPDHTADEWMQIRLRIRIPNSFSFYLPTNVCRVPASGFCSVQIWLSLMETFPKGNQVMLTG
jgi:hypothetical protein